MLGEYGSLADIPLDSVIDKLAGILDSHSVSDAVKGYLITALGKLCSQAQCSLSPQAHQLLHDAAHSRNLDLQQHALEIQALLRFVANTSDLPYWCEQMFSVLCCFRFEAHVTLDCLNVRASAMLCSASASLLVNCCSQLLSRTCCRHADSLLFEKLFIKI